MSFALGSPLENSSRSRTGSTSSSKIKDMGASRSHCRSWKAGFGGLHVSSFSSFLLILTVLISGPSGPSPLFSLNFAAMCPLIRHEAKGTVLIISPFNYPIWLSTGLLYLFLLSLPSSHPFSSCKRLIVIGVCFRPELSLLVTPFA